MSRVTTTVLVMMLLLNGTVTVMESSGLTDDLQVTLAPGVDETMDELTKEMQQGFSPSGGFGDTLFSLFAAAASLFRLLVESVWALPQMMTNLGFPSWVIIPFFAPMYLLSTLEIVFIATGRDAV